MPPDQQISVTDKIIAATNTLADQAPAEMREQLISLVNELINTDFNSLVQLLYRIDVDEKKLRNLLEANVNVNAASIIADVIIKRQLQKIAIEKQFESREKPAPGDSW